MKGVSQMISKTRLIVSMAATVLILGTCCTAFALEWGTGELDTEKLAINFAHQVNKSGYQLVATEELKVWLDNKEPMLVVDTMPFEQSYKKQHIPGALQIEFPVEEMTQFDDATKQGLEKLLGPDKTRKIVFYCGFTKCGRSHNAAVLAVKLGYTNVWRQPGGIKAWLEAGYPVEKVQ